MAKKISAVALKVKCSTRECEKRGTKRIAGRFRCVFHSKILSAIITSQRRGKKTPGFKEIEALFLANKNCPNCKIEFDYDADPKTQKRGERASLQHNADGTFSVLCGRCNSMDEHHPLGLDFISVSGKFCSMCKHDLPLEKFYVSPARSSGYSTYCKECNSLKNKMRADRSENCITRKL